MGVVWVKLKVDLSSLNLYSYLYSSNVYPPPPSRPAMLKRGYAETDQCVTNNLLRVVLCMFSVDSCRRRSQVLRTQFPENGLSESLMILYVYMKQKWSSLTCMRTMF